MACDVKRRCAWRASSTAALAPGPGPYTLPAAHSRHTPLSTGYRNVRIYLQLAYGLCIGSEQADEECELTSSEVEKFHRRARKTASNDTARVRPPLSNPFRAGEYAERGQRYTGSEGFENLF